MSIRVTTSGEPRALALAGLDGDAGEPVIHLGAGGEQADVVWREGTAQGTGERRRVIAQAGSGLWRCAPWPVRDELFELAPPAERNVLVVGDESDRSKVSEWLDDSRLLVADVLERGGLEDAAVVVFAQPDALPLPASAFAVLATGRMLVVRKPSVSFGLLPGIDHLSARTAAGAAELAAAAVRHWDAFAAVRAFGALAAQPHRASTVYSRLAHDLELADQYPARAGESGSSTVTTP
jgi:hypothetical protein